jgi:hypothetical protein
MDVFLHLIECLHYRSNVVNVQQQLVLCAQGAPEAFPTWEMWGMWPVPHVDGASKWGFHFPT